MMYHLNLCFIFIFALQLGEVEKILPREVGYRGGGGQDGAAQLSWICWMMIMVEIKDIMLGNTMWNRSSVRNIQSPMSTRVFMIECINT